MAAAAASSPILSICKCSPDPNVSIPKLPYQIQITRRSAAIASISYVASLSSADSMFNPRLAAAFEFGFVAPDQTMEEALSSIRGHARGLLDIRDYIESESWNDAQSELRANAGYLKQDIYTIIQNKPGKERAGLRKMYSDLFNDVTRLDYAARDEDKVRVLELYANIVEKLNAILSRI